MTRTENKIIRLSAAGRTPQEIAEELGITEEAVAAHLREIRRKLRAAVEAERAGLNWV